MTRLPGPLFPLTPKERTCAVWPRLRLHPAMEGSPVSLRISGVTPVPWVASVCSRHALSSLAAPCPGGHAETKRVGLEPSASPSATPGGGANGPCGRFQVVEVLPAARERARRSEGRSVCEVHWPLPLQGLFRLVSSPRGSPGVRGEGRGPKGQSRGCACHHTWPPIGSAANPHVSLWGAPPRSADRWALGAGPRGEVRAEPMQPTLPVMRRKQGDERLEPCV